MVVAPYEMEDLQMGGKRKVKFNLTSYHFIFFYVCYVNSFIVVTNFNVEHLRTSFSIAY